MASCVVESVFQLPACNAGDPDTYALHDAIYEALRRLPMAEYQYRTDYLPDYVSGNDVVALTVLASAAACAGVDVPEVLRPLIERDTGRPATPEDVTYVADNAGDLAAAVKQTVGVMRGEIRAMLRAARFLIFGAFVFGAVLGVAHVRREAEG